MVDLTHVIALCLAAEFVALGIFTMRPPAPRALSIVAGVLLAAAVVVTL